MDSEPADSATEGQRVDERTAAAPYVDVAPPPWWLAAAGGAWAGALVAMLALTERSSASVVGIGLLLLAQMAFVTWYPRRHGALPSRTGAPPEFATIFARYPFVLLAIMALTAAVWLLLDAWVAAGTAAVLVGVGLAVYLRAYADAAARTRQRLG
ncbi:hypothetical protein [Nocardioides sp. 503]|uniref:hypothetical protein n=1 Tax=Nocardioides sp. 503 TaxID=2508326 RepID=UPI00106F306F|nr:hypothetical protein [Nocardioides sp. 503]